MVVALYISVLDWTCPDLLLYAIGLENNPDRPTWTREENFLHNIIFSTILFILAMIVRRILTDYDSRKTEVNEAQRLFEERAEREREIREEEMRDEMHEETGKAREDPQTAYDDTTDPNPNPFNTLLEGGSVVPREGV